MKRHTNDKTLAKAAVAICIALGSLPAFAQDFNPPGNHGWYLSKASNAAVTTDGGQTVGTSTTMLYGRDFLIGGKGTIRFLVDGTGQNVRKGYVPISVSAAAYGSGCSTSSPCTITASVTTNNCTIQQTTWGLTSSTDFFGVSSMSLGLQRLNEIRACSGSNNSQSKTITSYLNGNKIYAVYAMGYKDATTIHESDKIYWSQRVQNFGNTDETNWNRVAYVCKQLGWKPHTIRDWISAKEDVKAYGYCRLSDGRKLRGTVVGPQPYERIATFPVVSGTSSVTVGVYRDTSAW